MVSPVMGPAQLIPTGRLFTITGDYTFTGSGNLTQTFHLINDKTETFGPIPIDLPIGDKYGGFVNPGEGNWKVRITLTPDNGVDTAMSVETTDFVKMSRATIGTVLPGLNGSEALSSENPAIVLDNIMQGVYSSSIQDNVLGSKRTGAVGILIAQLTAKPVLRIFRNNEEILRVKYTDSLIRETNGDNDVIMKTPAQESLTIYKASDLNTGKWRFTLQGYYINGLREITGSVGPTGSGKDMILSANPIPGAKFNSQFVFLAPRSIDELV